MKKQIMVQMMGEFMVSAGGVDDVSLVTKTRKGVALMEYLILNKGKQVPRQRLINVLWSDYLHTNPESALKTLVSRVRKILSGMSVDLSGCIVSERGSYRWENLPGMQVDMLEIMEIFELLARETDTEKQKEYYSRLLELYKGDLYLTGDITGGTDYQVALHNEYLNAVYDYIELLMKEQAYEQIIDVCRRALRIDEFDERLNMEMMQAQVAGGRVDDAMEQYRRAADMSEQYLDAPLSEEMQAFYKKIISSGNSLKYSLDSVKAQLRQPGYSKRAHLCDFAEFQNIFSLMSPTLERVGCSIFLGLITISDPGDEKPAAPTMRKLMDSLTQILCSNLRRGDVVAQYSDTMAAIMLPTVNYTTGNMVIERIRHLFFEANPGAKVPFHYRLSEVGGNERGFQ